MKIVVCFKNVPDGEKIKVKTDGTLDFSIASPVIGQYDLNAVEAAAQLAAKEEGSEVIALTVAGSVINNTKQRKSILSRGADKMLGIRSDSFDDADTYCIASAIAETVKKLEDVDLVLFGEGSSDIYAQQTGPMTGAILGWENINAVSEIKYEKTMLSVTRDLEASSEQMRVKLPAVVSVTSDINRPRIPSMKDILAAGKKPVEVMEGESLSMHTPNKIETLSVLAPETGERRKILFDNISEEALDVLALEIRKLM